MPESEDTHTYINILQFYYRRQKVGRHTDLNIMQFYNRYQKVKTHIHISTYCNFITDDRKLEDTHILI